MQSLKGATYPRLREGLEEMYDHLHSQDQDIKYLSNENQYLNDYLEWKGLTEEFEYFRSHAHKEFLDEDQPFETYVL